MTPEQDLAAHWDAACECDVFDGSGDFFERMEAAGLCERHKATRADLEAPFAAEYGIEKGGMVWRLTESGKRAVKEWSKA